MKTLLLAIALSITFCIHSQTTHQISWQIGSNGTAASLTIDVGDTVQWNWDDTAPHTVTNKPGSTETFNSGSKTGINETYSYTFTMVGSNDYQCDFHPGTMFGTITVQDVLGLEEQSKNIFKLISDPFTDILTLELTPGIRDGKIRIHDMIGKEVFSKNYADSDRLEVNVSNLNDAVYILYVQSNGKEYAKRFIKQ